MSRGPRFGILVPAQSCSVSCWPNEGNENVPGWGSGRLRCQPMTLRGLPFVTATLVEDPPQPGAFLSPPFLPQTSSLLPHPHPAQEPLSREAPPSSALAPRPQETPACLSPSISSPAAPGSRCAVSTRTCSLAHELIPRIQPLLTSRARGERSPEGSHSSVPATDFRLERGPRPRPPFMAAPPFSVQPEA